MDDPLTNKSFQKELSAANTDDPNELEDEGRAKGEMRLYFDLTEILESANKFLDEVKCEILVLVSREGGIKDKEAFFQRLRSKATQGLRVRVLARYSEQDAPIVKELEEAGVEVRKLEVGRISRLSVGIYDRKNMVLTQYHSPSVQGKSSGDPFISGVILTNRHIIPGIASMFESLWEENELRRRSELMQNILSHDIRNYNQVARANAELLLLERSDDSETDRALHSIISATDNSTALLQKARILGSITWQKKPMLVPVSLSDSFERSLSLIRKANPDANIELTISSKLPGEATVIADDLLDQVFVNILSNAVKHANGKQVLIDVNTERVEEERLSSNGDQYGGNTGRYWKVAIADHGKGISDEAKQSVSMRYRGTGMGRGLGLSIVRALVVDRYSGRLELKNRVEGDYTQGTNVEVWLPKAE